MLQHHLSSLSTIWTSMRNSYYGRSQYSLEGDVLTHGLILLYIKIKAILLISIIFCTRQIWG